MSRLRHHVLDLRLGVPEPGDLHLPRKPQKLSIPQLGLSNGEPESGASTDFHVTQGPQVAVLTDACNECGNCVTFCPTSDRPWRDKPRLYLHRGDFEAETDNAFMFITHEGARGLQATFEGAQHQLIEDNGVLRYTSPAVELSMDAETLEVLDSAMSGHPADAGLVDPLDHLGTMIVARPFVIRGIDARISSRRGQSGLVASRSRPFDRG